MDNLKAVGDYWRKVKSGGLPAPGPNEISITVCALDDAVSRIAALLAELEAKTKHISDMERVVAAAKCDDELWDAMAHRLKTLEAKLATPVLLASREAQYVDAVDATPDEWFEALSKSPVLCAGLTVDVVQRMAAKLAALMRAANQEAQPLGYIDPGNLKTYRGVMAGGSWSPVKRTLSGLNLTLPIYLAPPAPAVPDAIGVQEAKELFNYLMTEEELNATVNGYNACRAAMLTAAPEGGNG